MIDKLLYMDLRRNTYSKRTRLWLFEHSVRGLGQEEVLEVHDRSQLFPLLPEVHRQGLTSVVFRDSPGRLITQVCRTTGTLRSCSPQTKNVAFYIDARYIPIVQLVRQTVHVLHRIEQFAPRIEQLVIWSKDLPQPFFDLLDRAGIPFHVDACAKGHVSTTLVLPAGVTGARFALTVM